MPEGFARVAAVSLPVHLGDVQANVNEILAAMDSLDAPTIYAVHPRNHERAQRVVKNNGFKNIILTQPVKYSDSVQLVSRVPVTLNVAE